jgi:hypothetical protein
VRGCPLTSAFTLITTAEKVAQQGAVTFDDGTMRAVLGGPQLQPTGQHCPMMAFVRSRGIG